MCLQEALSRVIIILLPVYFSLKSPISLQCNLLSNLTFRFFQGHQDSVTSALFSYDGAFLATGDMSGLVKVWRSSDGKDIWSFETGELEVPYSPCKS